MQLEQKTIPVTFRGLQQSSPRQLSAPGSLVAAENVIVRDGDENVGFEFLKRHGIDTKVTAADGTGARLVTHNGSLLVQTNYALLNYIDRTAKLNSIATNPTPRLPQINVGRTSISVPYGNFGQMSSTASSVEMTMVGNVAVYAFLDGSGNLYTFAYDHDAGATLDTRSADSGVSNIKCVALNGSAFVFYKKANALMACKITPSLGSVTFSGPTTVVASGSLLAGTDYDVQSGWNSTNIAAIYRTAAGSYRRALLDSTPAVTATTVDDATAANQPDVGLCWLAQSSFAGGSLYYATINAANGTKLQQIAQSNLANQGTTSQSLTTGITFTGYVSGGTPNLIAEQTATNSYDHRLTNGNGTTLIRSVGLGSRAFFLGGTQYVVALYNSASGAAAPQDTYFLIDLSMTFPRAVGRALGGIGGRLESGHVSSAIADSSGAVHFVAKNVISVESNAGASLVVQYGISDISLAFASTRTGAGLSFGNVVSFPGPMLAEFDGVSAETVVTRAQYLHENNFHLYPEPITLTGHSGTGGSMGAGTYAYVAVYFWTDSSGQISRSAASVPVTVVLGAGGSSVDVSVPTLRVSTRDVVGVEVYRTLATGDQSAFYRVSAVTFTGFSSNDATTFTDTIADATAVGNNPLYTDSGEVENICPPAFSVVCEHNNRLMGVPSEEPWIVMPSKEYVPGFGIGFFDGFKIITPQVTGPIYAMASFDRHLLLFKRDTIYIVSGDFPDNTAGGNILPPAINNPAAAGTTLPCSLLVMQIGVVFYSPDKGFWLIDRALQTQFIGSNAEDTAAGQIITSAVLHQTEMQARFTSQGGTTFVLDLFYAQRQVYLWTTFTGHSAAHAIVYKGTWTLLSSAGALKQENAVWSDDAAAFTSKLSVADINFNGINGYVRVWRGRLVGEWKSAHTVQIVETPTGEKLLAGPETFQFVATTDPSPYELEFRPAVQKVRSMSVDITDVGNTGEGFAWTALTFDLGVLPKLRRMAQTSTMQ